MSAGSSSFPNPVTLMTWQRHLSEAVRSSTDLLKFLQIPAESISLPGLSAAAEAEFPVLVPLSFLQRMTPGDPNDPLLRQVLALGTEQNSVPGFVSDPVADADAHRMPGLLQKYAGRALLMASGACAVHCRYCFRREYPYADEPRRTEDWEPALREIAKDGTLSEIILSGGDPLMLSDDRLSWLCRKLDDIPHLERIRLHTRLPIVLPDRVTEQLLTVLTARRCQTIMVVHANHANELTADCAIALKRLTAAGIPVLNQAVLLKGINDSVDILEHLCRRAANLGVMPYYLHQLDRVRGAADFEVPVDVGQRLMTALAERLPGYAVPKYVQEIPGQPGKTLIR